MRYRTRLLAIVIGASAAAPALAADAGDPPSDAPGQIELLNRLGAEDAGTAFHVERWVKRPAQPERVLKLGDTYVVQEAGSAELFLASEEEPGKLEGGDWRSVVDFLRGAQHPPLPAAPQGWSLRDVFHLGSKGVRLASLDGKLYILCTDGDVYRFDPALGKGQRILRGRDYDAGHNVQGLCFDAQRRMYVVTNDRDGRGTPVLNRVVILRSQPLDADSAPKLRPWLTTEYPFGIGAFNHGVGHITFGPDGMLYVGSGSRTDANEAGDQDRMSKDGETPLTSCVWRLDPNQETPTIETFADGLRNPFGFCFDDRGRLFATDNGPNQDPPEELNLIERGKHYGFPYVFSDWTKNPYPHVGAPPEGQVFTPPIPNVGPSAGGSPGNPLSTFDAHSSPAGIAWLDASFPPAYRGAFLVARFGNLLPVGSVSVGFDVLAVRLRETPEGGLVAETEQMLHPLARPIDVHVLGPGTVYVLEHSRQAGFTRQWGPGDLPGRVLELKAVAPD